MACPYSIDIELLHDHDILDHIRLAHHISLIWVHLMTVRTLDKDRLAVHEKLAFLDLHISETELKESNFCHTLIIKSRRIICFIKSCDIKSIKPRGFSCPLFHSRELYHSPCKISVADNRSLHQ